MVRRGAVATARASERWQHVTGGQVGRSAAALSRLWGAVLRVGHVCAQRASWVVGRVVRQDGSTQSVGPRGVARGCVNDWLETQFSSSSAVKLGPSGFGSWGRDGCVR